MRTDRHPGQPDQAGQQRQPEAQRRVLQPHPDGERGGAGGMTGRQRIGRRTTPDAPDQRHRIVERTRPPADALGDLVGHQAGDPQRHHSANGAALRRVLARRDQQRRDDEPQLRVVGRPGQWRHCLVEQRGRTLRNRLKQLTVESPQPPGDLFDTTQRSYRPFAHCVHPTGGAMAEPHGRSPFRRRVQAGTQCVTALCLAPNSTG